MTNPNVVHTFWTGGWDSTFRVLQLVIDHQSVVQPHYVIDPERLSVRQELLALEKIRESLQAFDPRASARLLPTRFALLNDIRPDPEITRAYAELREKFELSTQYDWLNRYAKQHGIIDLEMGFQKDDDAPHFEELRAMSEASRASDGSKTWRLPEHHESPNLVMFERFSFPNLWLTKSDMLAAADNSGFLPILELSWFCHYPVRDQPCGACSVCRHVMDAGMPQRFSRSGMLRNKIWRIYHPLRLLVSHPERFRQRISDIRRWGRQGATSN